MRNRWLSREGEVDEMDMGSMIVLRLLWLESMCMATLLLRIAWKKVLTKLTTPVIDREDLVVE